MGLVLSSLSPILCITENHKRARKVRGVLLHHFFSELGFLAMDQEVK